MPERERWINAWRTLGVDADAEAFADLVARYAEPHRHYHTMQHLDECFAHWCSVRVSAERPGEVELALWYHDAVYDPHRGDSEERSAALARAAMLGAGLSIEAADRVEALILATRHESPPGDGDAALLVDVDLAILAAPLERFDEYERQVREEYAWVPGPIFRRKRREVLQALLERPCIYSTPHFRREAEEGARANLRRSIAQLDG